MGLQILCNSQLLRTAQEVIFTSLPVRAVRVVFSLMPSGWAGGQWQTFCTGCISETIMCRKLILGRDI